LDDAIEQKGIKRVSSHVGLRFTAFNLRRIMNNIDKNDFKKSQKELTLKFS